MLPMIIFFVAWATGVFTLFFYLKNQNHSLRVSDVLITFILSGVIDFVFSFAAYKANLNHWALWIVFAGLGAIVTGKLLSPDLRPKKMYSFNPMLAIPLLNIFHSGGLWLLPLAMFAGSARCFWLAGKASKSNSTQQVDLESPNAHTVDNTGNVKPGTEGNRGYVVWGVALFLIGVASLIVIAHDYKGV